MPKIAAYSKSTSKKNFKKYLSHFLIVAVALLLTVPLLKSQNLISMLQKTENNSAAAISCQGQFNIGVSLNGNSPTSAITVPRTVPRYYLHLTSGGQNCSNQFEVLASLCDLNGANCSTPAQTSPFGLFRSNSNGIARLDLFPFKIGGDGKMSPWSETTAQDGIYKLQFRPYLGTSSNNIAWSNQVSVTINNTLSNTASVPPNQNMLDYIVYRPGDTYIYDSISIRKNAAGTVDTQTYKSRLQLEQERLICGIRVTPWRFTKNNMRAYWEPHTTDSFRNLRWMITSPNFAASSSTGTVVPVVNDNFIWGLRDKLYYHKPIGSAETYQTDDMGLRDINPNQYMYGVFFGSVNGRLPAYSLAQKSQSIPFLSASTGESNYFEGDRDNPNTTGSACPPYMVDPKPRYGGSWMYRVEKDSITTPAGTYSDVARIDYFESTGERVNPFTDNDPFLRESWYYAKGIGLVEVRGKLYNGVMFNENGVSTQIKKCSADSDCLNDTIEQPFTRMTLRQYFPSTTQFNAQVSKDGSSYTTEIATTPSAGYFIKVSPGYTGYLEVIESNTISKWVWVENGVGKLDLPASIQRRKYVARVRIWAPNDKFDNEQLLNNYNAPWSNEVVVTVSDTLPNRLPTGNFDSATSSGGAIRVSGWSYDPDQSAQTNMIRIYNGTTKISEFYTNSPRPDVNSAYGITGNHGFDASLTGQTGTITLKVVAVDITTGQEVELGNSPRTVTVSGSQTNRTPTGTVTSVTSPALNTLSIQGNAQDPDTATTPVTVTIYDNGATIKVISGPTFTQILTGIVAGTHTIRVTARDTTTNQEVDLTGSPKQVVVQGETALPPVAVGQVTASCNATGTQATINWTSSSRATNYLFRADRQKTPGGATDGWIGTCPFTTAGGGDVCLNGLTTTSQSITTNPNTPYNVWVHAVNDYGISTSTNVLTNGSPTFTCNVASSTPVPTLAPTGTPRTTASPKPTDAPNPSKTPVATKAPSPKPTPVKTPTPSQSPIIAGNGLKADYYDNINFTNLERTKTDAKIDFDWDDDEPINGVDDDTFSVRWTGSVMPANSEQYRFYTQSDDGVRLWINNTLIIDNWSNHRVTENSGVITLAAGKKYPIRLDYFENKGDAVMKLFWRANSWDSKQIIPQKNLFTQ